VKGEKGEDAEEDDAEEDDTEKKNEKKEKGTEKQEGCAGLTGLHIRYITS
jgi:hypothetical protein